MLRTQEETFNRTKKAARDLDESLKAVTTFMKSYKAHSGTGLWPSADVPGQPYTVPEVIIEAQRVLRAVGSITRGRASLASSGACAGLEGAVQATAQPIGQLRDVAAAIPKENRPYGLGADLRITATLSGDEIFNVGTMVTSLAQAIDGVKQNLASVAIAARSDAESDDQELALVAGTSAALAKFSAQATAKLAEIETSGKTGTEIVANLEQLKTEITAKQTAIDEQLDGLLAAAEAARTGAEASQTQAGSADVAAQTKKKEIEDLLEESTELRDQLKEFSDQLEQVKTNLKAQQSTIGDANASQKIQSDEIERLLVRAESMVSGATVAGLARAFGDERKSLEKGMTSALISFFVGISLLFLVTVFLAAYVFEIPMTIGTFRLSGANHIPGVGAEITIAGVLSRIIILLAPFWLTLFSARRYRNLFDLRQQYSHKYNMAFSVDGFKQQAPKYEEDMAAWVFHIVAESPVSTGNKGQGMDENPLPRLQDMVKLPGERFAQLLNAAKSGEAGA
jgi:predicted  nucleic acid-binding Zn-ribbon protein